MRARPVWMHLVVGMVGVLVVSRVAPAGYAYSEPTTDKPDHGELLCDRH